jgi:hypothetical protein
MYVSQIEPPTDGREVFGHDHATRGLDKSIEWGEMHSKFEAEGADEATIKE